MAENVPASHGIASALVQHIVTECGSRGLSYAEILVCLETTVAIGITYLARIEAPGREERFAQEMMDLLTESAMGRVLDCLRAERTDGGG